MEIKRIKPYIKRTKPYIYKINEDKEKNEILDSEGRRVFDRDGLEIPEEEREDN